MHQTLSLGEEQQKNLIETAVSVDQKLTHKTLSKLNVFQHILQTFSNLAGFLLGFFSTRLSPTFIANSTTVSLALLKSARKPLKLNEQSRSNLNSAKEIVNQLQKRIDEKPAILILTTHPETVGQDTYLLGQLVYHAVKITETISPRSKLKLVQAIDPFALDTLHWVLEGVYAGYIATGHLAVDRQPYKRNFFQKRLFKKFHYTQAIFQITQNLKNGIPLCMALSGGVIHNSRIFYTIKEFAQRIYLKSGNKKLTKSQFEREIVTLLTGGKAPAKHHSSLQGQSRSYERIRRGTNEVSGVSSFRTHEETCACVTGTLSQKEREMLVAFLRRSECTEEELTNQIKKFEEELELKTPYRLRLFNVLFGRICARKTPLLLVPLIHSRTEGIVLNAPVLIRRYDMKSDRVISGRIILKKDIERCTYSEQDILETEQNLTDFVKQFVRNSLLPTL